MKLTPVFCSQKVTCKSSGPKAEHKMMAKWTLRERNRDTEWREGERGQVERGEGRREIEE